MVRTDPLKKPIRDTEVKEESFEMEWRPPGVDHPEDHPAPYPPATSVTAA
jgi:hypothetical protein